jgi:hypothetical protein
MSSNHPLVETSTFSVRIEATTQIDAPVQEAWSVLSNTSAYGSWNPFVQRLDGQLARGERIEVMMVLEGRKPQKLKPRIVGFEPGRSFEWLGQFGPRGVFDGRHRFELRPLTDERCELVQSEVLSGVLVPFFKRMLTDPTPAAFVALNEAFKARVENVA